MIVFDNYNHARYAKENCKSHKLLMSPKTFVDFYKQPSGTQQEQPRNESNLNNKR